MSTKSTSFGRAKRPPRLLRQVRDVVLWTQAEATFMAPWQRSKNSAVRRVVLNNGVLFLAHHWDLGCFFLHHRYDYRYSMILTAWLLCKKKKMAPVVVLVSSWSFRPLDSCSWLVWGSGTKKLMEQLEVSAVYSSILWVVIIYNDCFIMCSIIYI